MPSWSGSALKKRGIPFVVAGNSNCRQSFSKEISVGIIELHNGDASEVLSTFDDHYFDWIYVDADHSYKGVQSDIAVAVHKVKQDGLLVFDDYTYWSPLECQRYGVEQAVNELCVRDGWKVVYFSLGHFGYCNVAVRRLPGA